MFQVVQKCLTEGQKVEINIVQLKMLLMREQYNGRSRNKVLQDRYEFVYHYKRNSPQRVRILNEIAEVGLCGIYTEWNMIWPETSNQVIISNATTVIIF